MRRIRIGVFLAVVLLFGQAAADDRKQQAEVAETKASALEQLAAPEGKGETPSPSEIITKSEVQAVDPAGEEPLDDAITCLARTVYWEAKGEEADGMEAIAGVVMNRVGHEGFPDTVCRVVREGKERGDCQFSWWCDGRPDDVEEEKRYTVVKEIARKALNRQLADRTDGALYFHHRRVSPGWAAEYLKTAEVGEHLFYKPRNDKAK